MTPDTRKVIGPPGIPALTVYRVRENRMRVDGPRLPGTGGALSLTRHVDRRTHVLAVKRHPAHLFSQSGFANTPHGSTFAHGGLARHVAPGVRSVNGGTHPARLSRSPMSRRISLRQGNGSPCSRVRSPLPESARNTEKALRTC